MILLLYALTALWGQDRCGTAKDMVVRVRERIDANLRPAEHESLLQLLKQATQICVGQGDAWYYRSLIERQQGKTQIADLSLERARTFGSEDAAMRLDPFAGTEATAEPALSAVRRKYALVVGIGAFRDARIPALRFTAKDAEDMSALLRDPKVGRFDAGRVRLLTNERATMVNIKTELNWLARSAGPDDLVVIYLSSHGSPREMDTSGVNYVVMHDTDLSNQDSLYATSLPMIDLSDAVRTRIRARRVVVFLDTCYSGGGRPGARDLRLEMGVGVSAEALRRIRQGVGRVVITASSADEKSWEQDTLRNGIFTWFLMDALRKSGGLTPIDEMFPSVRQKVSESVRKEKGAAQTPTMHRSDSGAGIVIGVPEEVE